MRVSWTDTNAVAQCMTCGTPYKLECGKPAPTIMLREGMAPLVKRYWDEHARVIPSGFSTGYRDTSRAQEMATEADGKAFYEWLKEQTDAEG